MKMDHYEYYRLLGARIAYFRRIHGLSQLQLAEQVNISRTHMSRIETAECAVSLDVVFQIAQVLQEEPYKFFLFQ